MNIDSMTGDGADTTLTLSVAPVNENNVQVYFDGVYQSKSNYSVSGTTLTFTTAPPSGVAVEAITHSQTDVNVPVDGTITPAKIASGDFYFDTNTLYIDATNNRVGIGTSSPSEKLEVSNTSGGASVLIKTSATDGGNLLFGDTDSNSIGRIRYDHSANAMQFYANGSERARLDSSGRLGIGTSSPATSLHIANAGNSFLTLERTGTTGGTGTFAINMEGGSSQQTTMAYDDGGNLVIGRSSDPATQAGFSNDFV